MKTKLIFVCAVCLLMVIPMVPAQMQKSQSQPLQQESQHQTISVSVSNPYESFSYTQPPVPITKDGNTVGYLSIEVGGSPGPEQNGELFRTYMRWINIIALDVNLIPVAWERTFGIFSWINYIACVILCPIIMSGSYRPLIWHRDGVSHTQRDGMVLIAWLKGHADFRNNQFESAYIESTVIVGYFGDTIFDFWYEGPGWLV